MDYEKEYKEALERAKRIVDGSGNWRFSDLSEITPAVTEIFPELKESEDEMIRNRLINLIRELASARVPIMTVGYFVNGQDKKYIAYLEKQKDQKPAWSEEDEQTINMAIETLEYENYLILAKRLKTLFHKPNLKPIPSIRKNI